MKHLIPSFAIGCFAVRNSSSIRFLFALVIVGFACSIAAAQKASFGSGTLSAVENTFFDPVSGDRLVIEQLVIGTELDDTIVFNETADGLEVVLNGVSFSLQFVVGDPDIFIPGDQWKKLTVLGGGGNDRIVYNSNSSYIFNLGSFVSRSETGVHLFGGDGNDFLRVAGSATVDVRGGSGDDTISAADLGPEGVSVLYGDDGADTIFCGVGGHWAYGGLGDDLIRGGASGCRAEGGDGDDTITGGPGSDRIFGGLGNDFLVGGKGDDHIKGDRGDDQIFGGAGNDLIEGMVGEDTLNGGGGNDGILGGKGADTINGGTGNDSLVGGPEVDSIVPGAGVDHVDQDLAELQFAAPTGFGEVEIFEYLDGNGFDNVEVTISGTEARDVCKISVANDGSLIVLLNEARHEIPYASFLSIEFNGLGANDDFNSSADFTSLTVNGGRGDDVLRHVHYEDFVFGSVDVFGDSGDDIIQVSTPVGTTRMDIIGGQGDDVILGDQGGLTIYTGTGNNFVWASDDRDRIFGDTGSDIIYAKGGGDFIQSGPGADTIYAGAGDDDINSGTQWSRYDPVYGVPEGRLATSDAGDTVYGGDGNDSIVTGGGADEVFGGAGDDWIHGGPGPDIISGGLGEDTLKGGDGNDTICGNGGTDDIVGGGGTNVVKQ